MPLPDLPYWVSKADMFDKHSLKLFLSCRIQVSEQGDCKDLSLLLRTVGRENTAKILEVFEGKELSIPSEASKESRLKFINGYLRYSCNGESWDSVVAYLYGHKAPIRDRRSLRDGIREVKKRCDRYAIDIKDVLSKQQQSEFSTKEEGEK